MSAAAGPGMIPMPFLLVLGALFLACACYQVWRWVSPKKTPAPLLADNELESGDQDSSSMWMGGGGLSQARQMVSGEPASSSSFTAMG
eukprot:CAMPEP_0206605026 /NCGR_PEP_ID=MMETSP0325_2-20121206/50079_1 /ASSEMBLY_ACC=CAM_ASM_000347 /TAXON_ID=2866 /ORGANISM="Crypthecodinium cohnii, Strain Seligo" /LENGTH=87 /DNA_ID=CAMNT_0054120309 /DNA_START=95 /DNA_END=358 /DNA_ORIENTATION=-